MILVIYYFITSNNMILVIYYYITSNNMILVIYYYITSNNMILVIYYYNIIGNILQLTNSQMLLIHYVEDCVNQTSVDGLYSHIIMLCNLKGY